MSELESRREKLFAKMKEKSALILFSGVGKICSEDELYDFISEDIPDILNSCEHDFACDLLIRIARLLNDEVISAYDSWYNLVDCFMEQVNALSFSIYLNNARIPRPLLGRG